jgi:hypothetical protein
MIKDAEWAYYYDSKAAIKLGLSTDTIRKLAEANILRSKLITRKNGSTFYVINKEDVESFDLGKYVS